MRAEEKCRTAHNLTALSFSTATIAGTLSITTVVVNFVMLYIILKGQRNRPKSSGVVSIALVNTIIADLLTGLLTDTVVTASHIIEGLKLPVRKEVLMAGHVVHFLTTGAALYSVSLLSLDRIAAFMWPIKYKKSQLRPKIRVWHMFIAVWTTSALTVSIYFRLGFIKYLAVYASVNITIPAIFMILTIIVYRRKFGGKSNSATQPSILTNSPGRDVIMDKKLSQNGNQPKIVEPTDSPKAEIDDSYCDVSFNSKTEEDTSESPRRATTVRFVANEEKAAFTEDHGKLTVNRLDVPDDSVNNSLSGKTRSESMEDGFDSTYSAAGSARTGPVAQRKRRTDKRLLRALIINFAVFILTYLPTAIFIIYLNSCDDCDCVAVHVLRDAIGLFVRLASLLRPITFIVCSTSLREAFKKVVLCE